MQEELFATPSEVFTTTAIQSRDTNLVADMTAKLYRHLRINDVHTISVQYSRRISSPSCRRCLTEVSSHNTINSNGVAEEKRWIDETYQQKTNIFVFDYTVTNSRCHSCPQCSTTLVLVYHTKTPLDKRCYQMRHLTVLPFSILFEQKQTLIFSNEATHYLISHDRNNV